jgi:hypothetical protein
MSGVKAKRECRDEPWMVSIPIDDWSRFREYAQKIRLAMIDRGRDGDCRMLELAYGLRPADVEEIVGFHFDGVYVVEVEGD